MQRGPLRSDTEYILPGPRDSEPNSVYIRDVRARVVLSSFLAFLKGGPGVAYYYCCETQLVVAPYYQEINQSRRSAVGGNACFPHVRFHLLVVKDTY